MRRSLISLIFVQEHTYPKTKGFYYYAVVKIDNFIKLVSFSTHIMFNNSNTFKYPGSSFEVYEIPSFLLIDGPELYSSEDSLSVIPRNDVIYDDLLFTLKKNPMQYARPVVDLEHQGPVVKGNNVFFRAGLEAGLNSFLCDVNVNSLKNKHLSQFNLFPPQNQFSNSIHYVIFLDQNREFPLTNDLREEVISSDVYKFFDVELNSFPEASAIEYKMKPKREQDAFSVASVNTRLRDVLKSYGSIRSVNGIKPYQK